MFTKHRLLSPTEARRFLRSTFVHATSLMYITNGLAPVQLQLCLLNLFN